MPLSLLKAAGRFRPGRLRWQFRYAVLACRSPYDINFYEAWEEASASWEMNDDERGRDPMPEPSEALYEDQFEWGHR